MSNWAARPLSGPQIEYAAKDAYGGVAIFDEIVRLHGDGLPW